MSVFELKKGESAYIKKCAVTGSAAARLKSLGIVSGKKITLLAYSLFKSSVLISCGAVRLAIRKAVAESIEVEKCA